LEEETVRAFARDEARAGVAALENGGGGFEVEAGFGGGFVVAGDAVGFEGGEDVAVEIGGWFGGGGLGDAREEEYE